MLLASCGKSAVTPDVPEELVPVNFSVATEFFTRAESNFGTGANVDALNIQVFRVVAPDSFVKTTAAPAITKIQNGKWTVELKLAKGYKYRVAFWAEQSGNGIYDVTSLDAVSVDYSAIVINNDKADAFCAARELEVNGAITETVLLYRPLAQINFGSNDLAEYLSCLAPTDDPTLKVSIKLTDVPSKINVVGGVADADGKVPATVSTDVDVTFPAVSVLNVDDKLTVNSNDYEYLSMVYVLSDKDPGNTSFQATLTNSSDLQLNVVTVSNLPYQANYRTNIVGSLLTANLHFDVEIVPGFYTPNYELL